MTFNTNATSSGRVLIVDDDPLIRRLLAKIVRREGVLADTASDGVGAIERICTASYDAILLDLMMPRINGYEVVDFLKKRDSADRPIVVVITAYGDDEWHDLDPAVVTGVVRKPFEVAEVGRLLKLCIERHPTESNQWKAVPSLRLLRQSRS